MSTHNIHVESLLTPQQALLTDEIGNEVYASHYAERKFSRFVIGTETVLLLGAFGLIFSLAHRPIANRYIRIDEMGRAQAIAYTDLNYSPREGEVRTYLTDWANYRYTINRETVGKKYPLNYYFLSQALATQMMTQDNQNHLVSQVIGGQVEQSEVEVKNVTITSMSEETVQDAIIARGTSLVTIDKLYSPRNSREPRTEHWVLSVTYYLNPKQVSDQARIFLSNSRTYVLLSPLISSLILLTERSFSATALYCQAVRSRKYPCGSDGAATVTSVSTPPSG